jgi:hypothetical protein
MSFNFVADRIVKGKAYPAIAEWSAEPYTDKWRQFVQHWPNTVPCELHEHCATHRFPYTLSADTGDYYTVGLGFFNFDIDYFALIPSRVLTQNTTILFYYHEGDNPYNIKQRLDALCVKHNLSTNCYQFISGNTAADQIPGFHYFPDHELLYWHRNQQIVPVAVDLSPRPYDFTLLSRTHKWWRATVVADLHRAGLLNQSQWSYNTIDIGDCEQDNPIEVDTLDIRLDLTKFLSNAPYSCDLLSSDQHNDHHITDAGHYTNSYCNIVLETHFDADGSGGAFLTEKTFKPIKHAQPFVIVGAAGSLQALRKLGYRTFDHAIDNSYDLETNNTQRWILIRRAIEKIKQQNLNQWFASCLNDVKHNQQLFLSSKYDRLNTLYDKLLHLVATS